MEKFQDLVYVRPDYDAARANLEAYRQALQSAKDYAEFRAAWMEHIRETKHLDTMITLAEIRNSIDTTDAFYEEEVAVSNREVPTLSVARKECEKAFLASPFLPDVKAEFGDLIVRRMEVRQLLADEKLVPLQVEESDLGVKYSKLIATASTPFEGGEAKIYQLVALMRSDDRARRKAAFEAWSRLLEGIADEAEEIFDQLVHIRAKMAHLMGFDSFTDMAYLMRGRLDYGQKEAAAFRAQILKVVTPVCDRLAKRQAARLGVDKLRYYDENNNFPAKNPAPLGDDKFIVENIQRMFREISPESGEFFDFMAENRLFDLVAKPTKQQGGYCTSLDDFRAPFIFSNFNGTSADVDVLTHESGHAFQCYLAARCQILPEYQWSTSEIDEIHSMSMEHFAYPYMERFFGPQKDAYLYAHLHDAFTIMPYMCVVDEFQHRVYADVDMTKAQRRAVWHELEQKYMPWRDYDGNAFLMSGTVWLRQLHPFLYPFYYLDYALAQVGAFEFYGRSKADYAAAWRDYVAFCKMGGSVGYFALLKAGGLTNPFGDGAVAKVAAPVIQELESFKE